MVQFLSWIKRVRHHSTIYFLSTICFYMIWALLYYILSEKYIRGTDKKWPMDPTTLCLHGIRKGHQMIHSYYKIGIGENSMYFQSWVLSVPSNYQAGGTYYVVNLNKQAKSTGNLARLCQYLRLCCGPLPCIL